MRANNNLPSEARFESARRLHFYHLVHAPVGPAERETGSPHASDSAVRDRQQQKPERQRGERVVYHSDFIITTMLVRVDDETGEAKPSKESSLRR